MTLDALADEIASQAEAEARSIVEDAEKEAGRIEEEARKDQTPSEFSRHPSTASCPDCESPLSPA